MKINYGRDLRRDMESEGRLSYIERLRSEIRNWLDGVETDYKDIM